MFKPGGNAAHLFILKKSIKSTVALEQFLGPDGFCSCSVSASKQGEMLPKFYFLKFHQIDCCTFAANAHYLCGIIFEPRRFLLFVLFWGGGGKCCPIFREKVFRFRGYENVSVGNRGNVAQSVSYLFIKSIVAHLLQMHTTCVEKCNNRCDGIFKVSIGQHFPLV